MATALLDFATDEFSEADLRDVPRVYRWTRDEYRKMQEAGFFREKRMELIDGEILERYEIPDPRPYQWTRSEYHRLHSLRFFEHKKVEFIEGQVIDLNAMGSSHAAYVMHVSRVLGNAFGDGWCVWSQCPLDIHIGSEPLPDIAVLQGDPLDYVNALPRTADLIVEVAVSSIAYDRSRKAGLYARAYIWDYWILNVKKRQLEIYRQPVPDAAAPFGFKYRSVTVLKPGAVIAPLAAPEVSIAVADLLP
jgi:Uma2 family endonuclease